MFISLIEWYMSGLSEEALDNLSDQMSAAEKIRTMLEFFLGYSEQLVPFFKITIDFWAQTSEDEQLRAFFDQMLTDFQQQMGSIIEQGIASGEFRPVSSADLALALVAALDALTLYKTLLSDKIDIKGAAEALLEVVIAGLRAKGAADVP